MDDDAVRAAWIDATSTLGGDASVAAEQAVDLVARYRDPPRSYHDTVHVAAVLRDAAGLCEALAIPHPERAGVLAAACAHDVVYLGRPGEDERDSADWARRSLASAGVDARHVERVHSLVLATAEHRAPPDDAGAAVLLDADLAILASPPERYAAYVAAVRSEYAHVDDEQWRTGRGDVLRDLLARDPLYASVPARERWAVAARTNLTAELAELAELAEPTG